MAPSFWDSIKSGFEDVGSVVEHAASAVTDKIGDAGSAIIGGVTHVADDATSIVKTTVTTAGSTISNVAGDAKDAVSNVAKDAGGVLTSAVGDVKSVVSTVADDAKGALGSVTSGLSGMLTMPLMLIAGGVAAFLLFTGKNSPQIIESVGNAGEKIGNSKAVSAIAPMMVAA